MRANGTTSPCVLSPTGMYRTQDECQASTNCGWKYGCVNNACVLVAGGTYDTAEQCLSDEAAQCGWKFACSPDADPFTYCTKVPPSQGMFNTPGECRCITAVGPPGPTCSCTLEPSGKGQFQNQTVCQSDATLKCGWKTVDQFAYLPTVLIQMPADTPPDNWNPNSQTVDLQLTTYRKLTAFPVACTQASKTYTYQLKYMYVAYYVDYVGAGGVFQVFTDDAYSADKIITMDITNPGPQLKFSVTRTNYDNLPKNQVTGPTVDVYTTNVAVRIAAIAFSQFGDLTLDQVMLSFEQYNDLYNISCPIIVGPSY